MSYFLNLCGTPTSILFTGDRSMAHMTFKLTYSLKFDIFEIDIICKVVFDYKGVTVSDEI